MREESGLRLSPQREIIRIDQEFAHPATGEPVEDWHSWLFVASLTTPDSWTHAEDEDFDFSYRWVAVDGLSTKLHPQFETVANSIEQMFGSEDDDH